MHTGDINFPALSPGPILRTGKAWEKPSQAVPWDPGLWAGLRQTWQEPPCGHTWEL